MVNALVSEWRSDPFSRAPFEPTLNEHVTCERWWEGRQAYYQGLAWWPEGADPQFRLYGSYDLGNGETVHVVWDWRGTIWYVLTLKWIQED